MSQLTHGRQGRRRRRPWQQQQQQYRPTSPSLSPSPSSSSSSAAAAAIATTWKPFTVMGSARVITILISIITKMICLQQVHVPQVVVSFPLSPQRHYLPNPSATRRRDKISALAFGIDGRCCIFVTNHYHYYHHQQQQVQQQQQWHHPNPTRQRCRTILSLVSDDHQQQPSDTTRSNTSINNEQTTLEDNDYSEEDDIDAYTFDDDGIDDDGDVDGGDVASYVVDDDEQIWIQQNAKNDDLRGRYDPSRIQGAEIDEDDDDYVEKDPSLSSISTTTRRSVNMTSDGAWLERMTSDGAWLERATRVLLGERLARQAGNWTMKEFDVWERTFYGWCHRVSSVGYRPAYMQEKLIRRLVEEQEACNPLAWNVDMNAVYHQLIRTWYRAGGRGTSRRCEDILDAMQDLYNSGDEKFQSLKPEIASWNHVILAYAKSKTNDAPNQAVRVLSKLHNLFIEGKTDVLPDQQSYVAILKAYAGLGGQDAPKRVLKVLDRMTQLADQGYSSLRPGSSCHNVYMQSLINSLELYEADIPAIVRTAESHFQKMTQCQDPAGQPDLWTYNTLLTLLSRSGHRDSADRAEALVQQIEEKGWTPSCLTFNCLMAAYTQSPRKDKADKAINILEKMKRLAKEHPECQPDRVSYNTAMNVCAKTNNVDALSMPDKLIKEMEERYKETNNPDIKPTTMSWNICFDAWTKSDQPDAPKRIWKQIEVMEATAERGDKDVLPNQYTYNIYLQSLAKQRTPWCADEAERMLKFLNEKSMDPGREELQPDVLTYTNVLHAIAVSGAEDSFHRAYSIMQEMEEGDMDVRPNVYTYNVIINAVAKSKILGKAKIAVQLLRRMKEVSIVPITITLNNILNACAYSDRGYENRREILDIALLILKEAQTTCGANYITYGSALRVIRFFADDYMERWQLIRRVFRECLRDGQFAPSVMGHLQGKGLTSTHYDMLVKEATDPETGRWKKEYMTSSKKIYSPQVIRGDSPRQF